MDIDEIFCIIRAVKLSSFGSIAGSTMHTFREIRTPNVDMTRSHLNRTIGPNSAAAVVSAIKNLLPERRRKDAVLCIEYLITASPKWFKRVKQTEHEKYFEHAIKWLKLKHGDANVVCLNYQLDETSPHLVAYVVPILPDGRLCAKEFLGGRERLSKMQTDFWQVVGEKFGLSRGLQGSTSKHVTAKQYSAALSKRETLNFPVPPELTLLDHFNGNSREQQLAYRNSVLKHMRLSEQMSNIAKQKERARASDRKILESLKLKEKEIAEYREKIDRLETSYAHLERRFSLEKIKFNNSIDHLKAEVITKQKDCENFSDEQHNLRALLQMSNEKNAELRKKLNYFQPLSSPGMSP